MWWIQVKIGDSEIQIKTILSFVDVKSFLPNKEICDEINSFLILICFLGVAVKMKYQSESNEENFKMTDQTGWENILNYIEKVGNVK